MRRRFVLMLTVVFCTHSAFSQNSNFKNDNKIWPVNSKVYKNITYLYQIQKHALPSSSGPWSTAELKLMLAKIDVENADPEVKKLYDKTYGMLYKLPDHILEEQLALEDNYYLTPEFYLHTNETEFNKEADWWHSYEERSPLFRAVLETYAAKHFYAYFNISLGWAANISKNPSEPDMLYAPVFMSNIPFVPQTDISCLGLNFPDRAFLSAGGEHWNISAGRDVNRWGNGESGNLFLGGTQLYDNTVRFSTFFDSFKYSFAANFYPHEATVNLGGQNDPADGLKMFMAHRIEGRVINDRLCFAVSEGVLYQSAASTLDIRVFNPLGFFHNYYIRGNANSLLSIDLDFAAFDGFNVYGQYVIDEITGPGEPDDASENGWRPSKNGYLLGVKYVSPLPKGILKLSLEGVYADPYMYLREKYDSSDGTQGTSFYGHLREFQNIGEMNYLRKCIGYTYGGDCITGNFNAVYDSLEKWCANAEVFFMAHGIMTNPVNEDWIYGKGTVSPSTEDITENPTNPSGEPEYVLRISAGGSYEILDNLKVNAGIDNYFIWNKEHAEKDCIYDMQFHTGLVFNF